MRFTRWAAVAIAPAAMVAGFVTAGHASASTAARHSQTPAARACTAFARWDGHRSARNLNALLTASETAPWHVIGVDAVVLYTDARDRDTLDLPDDVKAMGQDCRRVR